MVMKQFHFSHACPMYPLGFGRKSLVLFKPGPLRQNPPEDMTVHIGEAAGGAVVVER